MNVKLIKNAVLLHFQPSRNINLSIYCFKAFSLALDFKTTSIIDRQITELIVFNLYFQLVTPILLIWVSDDKLMDFALNVLKNRSNDIEDNLAEYLLGDSVDLDHDAIAESQVLYKVLSFYGVDK